MPKLNVILLFTFTLPLTILGQTGIVLNDSIIRKKIELNQSKLDSVSFELADVGDDRGTVFRYLSENVSGQISYQSRYGLLDDYFGKDSANAILRNSFSGSFDAKMTNYLSGNLKFQVVDKNLPFSNNNYFNFSLVPIKPTFDKKRLDHLGMDKKAILDSLERESKNMLGFLDAEISKLDRQKDRLRTFQKFGIDPNYKIDTNQIESRANFKLDSVGNDSRYKELIETKTKVLQNLEKIDSLKNKIEILSKNPEFSTITDPKRMKLNRFQLGRINSRPEGASISVPMDGISFEIEKKRCRFMNESGLTRENYAQFQNPIDRILTLSNQPFDQYLIDGKRIIQNNNLQFKFENESEIYYKFGYTSKSLSKSDTSHLGNFSSVLNAIGFNYLSRRVKNVKVGLEIGKVETDDTLNFTKYPIRNSNWYQKGKAEYSINKTQTTLGYIYENFENDAYQIGYTNVRKDFETQGIEVRQQFTGKCSLIFKEQRTWFKSSEASNLETIKQHSVIINLSPLKGLNLTSSVVGSTIDFRGMDQNRKNLILNFAGNYQWKVNTDKYNVGINVNNGSVFTFTSLVTTKLFSFHAGIKKENSSLSNTYNQSTLWVDEELIQDAKINSLKYSLTTKNDSEWNIRWDCSILNSGFDNGGEINYHFPLNDKMSGSVAVIKYVKGSIPSIFQPKRLERIPLEFNIKLSMKL